MISQIKKQGNFLYNPTKNHSMQKPPFSKNLPPSLNIKIIKIFA